MRLKTRFNAKAGAADLWDYVREPRPFRWTFLFISAAIPLAATMMLAQESHFRAPEAPEVTYISTFAEGRSDEEIRQTNLENQRRQDELDERRAQLLEQKVEAYKTLGRATGLDVDTMERRALAERAREQAAEEARRRELYRAGNSVANSGE